MSDVLRVLNKAGKMSSEMVEKVTAYIAENTFQANGQVIKLPQQVRFYFLLLFIKFCIYSFSLPMF